MHFNKNDDVMLYARYGRPDLSMGELQQAPLVFIFGAAMWGLIKSLCRGKLLPEN